ncbi:MAG: fumarylacetoacetate hydrolase family protein [Clostridia bacterium]|nr:fumarylacetoacetate hydrolase family protein [Clostridia bacterium]
MIWVRFVAKDQVSYGLLEGQTIRRVKGDPYQGFDTTEETFTLGTTQLLCPCVPTKIIAIGLNYADHARESNLEIPKEPVVFLKAPSALIGPKQDIIYPRNSRKVEYEAELAIVIGKQAKRVSQEKARDFILGYTCANDVSARDWQFRDGGQWTLGKSFDTFAPIGPWINSTIDPSDLAIKSKVNGEVRQDSSTREMIFGVNFLVSFLSQVMTLEPGDVILTGTPPGVGTLRPGDEVTIEIEGLGELTNRVVPDVG